MKLLKKVLLAIIVACSLIYIMPTIMPIDESGYVVSAASVKISKTKYKMNKGEKFTLKITGTNKTVKWSTSNKKIATVNSKGKVTAKKKGTVTITAKVGSKKFKCKITVEAPSISKKTYTMKKGKTVTLKIKGTTQKITWSSNNKKVATVNSKGKVTAKKNGTATITAKVGKSKYKCKITVGNVVKISETEHAMNVGENFTLKITGTSEKITWSSSDTSIATVDKNGKVIAKKEGTATITGTVGKTKYTCTVYVENLDPWWCADYDIAVQKGHTYNLSFHTKQKITWSSSDSNIAKVDKDGIVTGVNVGKATITAKVGNKKLDFKLLVRDFKKDITMTTKASHDSDDSLGCVMAYFTNNSSISYLFDAEIHFYDANKKEILSYVQYNVVSRAGATIAYPFPFRGSEYDDYASYEITVLDSDYFYVENVSNNASKVTVGVYGYDDEKRDQGIYEQTEDVSKLGMNWSLWIKNDSDKKIKSVDFSIVGYNEEGEISFYYVDDERETVEAKSKVYCGGSRIFPTRYDEEKDELCTLTPYRVDCYVLDISEE